MIAEFEYFGIDELSVVFHAYANRLFMRAGLERYVVVLFQRLIHNNRHIV